jgi:hypothetical protein
MSSNADEGLGCLFICLGIASIIVASGFVQWLTTVATH